MTRPDVLEVHFPDGHRLSIYTSFAPARGDLIHIQKVTYRVSGLSWAVDHAAEPGLTQMNCVITLEATDIKPTLPS